MLSIPQGAQQTKPHPHRRTVVLLQKPFIHGCAAPQGGPYNWFLSKNTSRVSVRVRLNKQRRGCIKAVVSTDATELQQKSTVAIETQKSVNVKAVLSVQVTIGGFLSSIGLKQGLNCITDLLGKSLLLELVSAELDPGKCFNFHALILPEADLRITSFQFSFI